MRLSVLLVLVLGLAPLANAQRGGDPVERLAEVLELDDDQADLVAELLDPQDPGSSWVLAAELLPTLTEAQRETLFSPPDVAGRGQRTRQGGQRAGQGRQRAGRQPDPSRQAITRAARNAALELTDEQQEQFDAYETAQRERGPQGARDEAARAQARADLEAFLSADQIDIVETRQAIQRLMRRGGGRGAQGSS